jgi:hypothetical protein
VPREADEQALESLRKTVERELDRVHERAYALVGSRDPGARRNPILMEGSQA